MALAIYASPRRQAIALQWPTHPVRVRLSFALRVTSRATPLRAWLLEEVELFKQWLAAS